jgi:hypothetical protein
MHYKSEGYAVSYNADPRRFTTTMPIDYSQPGLKEMFANYGLTALAAQAMEKTLFLLLAAVECLEARKVSKSELYKVFDRHDRKTLGQLIAALRKKIPVAQNLDDDLNHALDKRNYVAHNFFLDRWDNQRLIRHPEQMSEELLPIRDLFDDVQNRINDILGIVQRQFEVPYAKLDQQAKEMLKIYQSSNKSVERDAP